jgi:hypothetical protein
MPLRKGKSKKVLTYNIGEMMRSPTFAEGKSRKKKQQGKAAVNFLGRERRGRHDYA